jgi:hypothetical protein
MLNKNENYKRMLNKIVSNKSVIMFVKSVKLVIVKFSVSSECLRCINRHQARKEPQFTGLQ